MDESSPHFSVPTDAEYFRLLLKNVTDYAVFSVDIAGHISAWNTGAERILGYSEAEILGQPVDVIFTPEDRASGIPADEFETARIEGRTEDERWHAKKDGTRFWASGILTALYNEQGQIRAYVKILRDFTERKRQEEALQEREGRLAHEAQLLDMASDSIFAHDLANRIIYWNHAAEQMYGYRREEALGQVAYQLLRTEFPQSFATTREDLFASGQWEGELVHTHRDGHKLIVASRWALERDLSGEPIAFLESNRDITQQKQAQEALLRNQEHIEALNERLQWAMTETHHRIKNSLQTLAAMLSMMNPDSEGKVGAEELRRLDAFIRSMAAIHDILTHESKEYGQVQTVSSKEFIERLVSLLGDTAGQTRRIHTSIQATRLSTQQATSLALILNELVANALKHTSGDVEVSFEIEANVGHLRVCDNGPGFPPQFNPRISANTGLELVEMLTSTDLGGQVLYANREEGGACVTVTVPLS